MPKPDPTPAWVKIARLSAELPPAAPVEPPAEVGTPDQQADFARGATLQRDGDQRAVDAFRQLADAPEPGVASAARMRLGEALLAAGRPAEALSPLAGLGPNAEFLMGRALRQLGRCSDALAHYEAFVGQNPGPLAAQGQAAIAECLQDLGRFDEAIAQLAQASQTSELPRLEMLDLRERLALARARAGDLDRARADYEALLAGARTNSYRAELNYYLGVLAPDPASAASRLRAALQTDPRGRAAQAALDELVALRDPAAASFEAGDARFEQSRRIPATAALPRRCTDGACRWCGSARIAPASTCSSRWPSVFPLGPTRPTVCSGVAASARAWLIWTAQPPRMQG
jgi:tetratricopeptide (TPR) repeat protein